MAYAETTPTTHDARGKIHTASGINLALGIWLIIAPFILATSGSAYWNDIVVGILVAILAGTRLAKPTASTKSLSWTNAGIGVWLLIAPFALTYATEAAVWNDIIVGVLLIIFGAWSAQLPREASREASRRV